MGLRGWLLRQAAVRPRVLVACCPYGTRARLLVEAELDRRGWPVASAPAEAGLLVVCGAPGAEMRQAVQGVWEAMVEPRALVEPASAVSREEVAAALNDAVETLARGGTPRTGPPPAPPAADMDLPGGVPMAGRGPDRDGLTLDRLHVPLGPVLADWPAGLVVDTVLQGDVIQEAVVRALPPGEHGTPFWAEPGRGAAARLDGLGRLLGVAGWPWAAREARRLRDRLLAVADGGGGRGGEVAGEFRGFARRVRGSVVLRCMLRGVGVVGGGGPERARGDVLDRAYRWVEEAEDAIGGPGRPGVPDRLPDRLPDRWPDRLPDGLLGGLLAGADLAQARLIVASVDPDLERVAVRRG
ncbi:MAG TPA: hypothetical protein VFV66_20750 [Nonomuraea sp.]|nr:hypothetical protein [Nonomuraea sp.]